MDNLGERVRLAVKTVEVNDRKLAEEFRAVRERDRFKEAAEELAPVIGTTHEILEGTQEEFLPLDSSTALETIVLRVGRPVLSVQQDQPVLEFRDAESEVWRERLTNAAPVLRAKIPSVGRIEVKHFPGAEYLGTGWMLDEHIVVTNRHVAAAIWKQRGNDFVFRQPVPGKPIATTIDFLEEVGRSEDFVFELVSILHIEDQFGPDIALLEVAPVAGKQLPTRIVLSGRQLRGALDVAVVGYPARDVRLPEQRLMEEIFGNVFEKKRLAPGKITGVSQASLLHDCSTLGGNSGSVVLDLDSGEALGLHYAGRFLEANFAVTAAVVKQRLEEARRNRQSSVLPVEKPSRSNEVQPQTPSANRQLNGRPAVPGEPKLPAVTATFTIPLQVTIAVGTPLAGPLSVGGSSGNATSLRASNGGDADGEDVLTEGTPGDYADRDGYDPGFLGPNLLVSLPQINSRRRQADVLTFGENGTEESVLKYRHFSVVMSRNRRLCLYSAVNVDGLTSRGMKRGGWRLDPRIPAEQQIIKECYGDPPRFSRGHMTRREDPIWGALADASQGNADSMHVTNVVPQMQPFNGGIWLGLEKYALDNAREDDMRISVFTGPVLLPNDPIRFGVQIPVTFWKIIAFVHDQTGKLCATGYTMSQEEFLRGEEFVFGQHRTAQVPIATIEGLTGLSFGNLAAADPLREVPETFVGNLLDLDQVRFV